MRIRPATPADIPQLIALERATDTAAHWGEGQYRALFDEDALRRIVLVAEMADEDIVPASSCERIIGLIVVRALGSEWEIENLIVKSELRRSGLGTSLFETVLELARREGCSQIMLEVRESNNSARKLYEKLGFRVFGRRSGYYENPTEDAVLLSYEFPDTALENA